MKKVQKWVLFLRIEWNWWFILYCRKRLKPLLQNGIPKADSPEYARILQLDRKNSVYCGRVSTLTQKFLAIS